MNIRCDIAIPSGLRRSRVFARLDDYDHETLVLAQACGVADATHQVVDACGQPLITFLSERDPGVATEIIRTGFWELPETVAVLLAVRPGAQVVDAGAHVGYYSVLLARAARREGRIYAFEPDADNFRTLSANASLTAQVAPESAPIVCCPEALTDRTGNVRLHRSDRNPGEHSLVPWPDAIDSRVVRGTSVDALRWGDDLHPQHRSQRERGVSRIDRPIDLLRVDVVNGEFELLRGAERTLTADRPIVAVTLRPAAREPDACLELVSWLAGHGYGTFRVFPPGVTDPYPFVCDVARTLNAAEVMDFLRRRPPVPHATLLAYPEPIQPITTVG